MKLIRGLIYLLFIFVLTACGGSSGGGGGGSSATFNGSSRPITIDDIANDTSSLVATTPKGNDDVYYGRFAYSDGTNTYAGIIRFRVVKNNSTTAYFEDFYLEYMAQITGLNTSTPVVTSSFDLSVTGSFSDDVNDISIENATSRLVDFFVDFGDNTHLPDITDGSVVFSSDFSTMIGGNDDSFFFVAQKADEFDSTTSIADLKHNWEFMNFTVSSDGNIVSESTSTASISGTGGSGYTAFTGNNSEDGAFDGEVENADSAAGLFVFGYGSGSGNPTATGVDGLFLLSPDKTFMLGIDLTEGLYFAGWK